MKPLVLFRCWRITYSEGKARLTSAAVNTIWRPGLNIAYCNNSSHDAPGKGCDCGLNGFYALPTEDLVGKTSENFIWGATVNAGAAMIHKDGARTAESQILALYASGTKEKDLKNLSEHYGIQVFEERENLLEFCRTHGELKEARSPSQKTIEHAVGRSVFIREIESSQVVRADSLTFKDLPKKDLVNIGLVSILYLIVSIGLVFGLTSIVNPTELGEFKKYGAPIWLIIVIVFIPAFFVLSLLNSKKIGDILSSIVHYQDITFIMALAVIPIIFGTFQLMKSYPELDQAKEEKILKTANSDIKDFVVAQQEALEKTGSFDPAVPLSDLLSDITTQDSVDNIYNLEISFPHIPNSLELVESVSVKGTDGDAFLSCVGAENNCETVLDSEGLSGSECIRNADIGPVEGSEDKWQRSIRFRC